MALSMLEPSSFLFLLCPTAERHLHGRILLNPLGVGKSFRLDQAMDLDIQYSQGLFVLVLLR
jgi:hypothetical protein